MPRRILDQYETPPHYVEPLRVSSARCAACASMNRASASGTWRAT